MRFDTGCPCCRDDFYDYEEWLMQRVTVLAHPLAQQAVTLLRDRTREANGLGDLLGEIGAILLYEIARDLKLAAREIEISDARIMAPGLEGPPPIVAPIGKSGALFIAGMRRLAPNVDLAPIAVDASGEDGGPPCCRLLTPTTFAGRLVIAAEPELTDGDRAIAAINSLKEAGASDLAYACAIAAPEGIEKLRCAHPDIAIWTSAIDSHLDARGEISPGLGDLDARLKGVA